MYMSHNVSNNHPIINNSNQYFYEKKYISISSEDRDISKYPNSSEFEILFPQEYLNVVSARLYSWSFPANYNVFSALQFNVSMSFKFETLYNPGEAGISDPLLEGIFFKFSLIYSGMVSKFLQNLSYSLCISFSFHLLDLFN